MKEKEICIVTFPYGKSGVVPSTNLVKILNDIFDEVNVITSEVFRSNHVKMNNSQIIVINSEWGGSRLNRIKNFLQIQIGISLKLLKLRRKFKQCIFFMGGDLSLAPILICKLFNKRIILCLPGSTIEVSSRNVKMKFFRTIIKLLVFLCMSLSDVIVLYSSLLIHEWNLERFTRKIVILHRHFLDFNKFKSTNNVQLHERDMIGFIGRFDEEKGIINFLEAIPTILENNNEKRFLIVGDGILKNNLEEFINKNQLQDKVLIRGWVEHEFLPEYLNKLELLVVPSFTEGLPNIILESMACGTPVLANNVGAIPEILKDRETGFSMDDNSPKTIAEKVIVILNYPELDKVSINAQKFVQKNFNYSTVLKRWRQIL